MKTETTLCMGCMCEKNYEGECRNCGYSDNAPYLSSYLAPKTFLADRYIIGKLISYNGEAACYMGYDAKEEKRVIIKEYMPDTLCTRSKDTEPITVNPDCLPLYKTYLSEFIDLNKSLMKSSNVSNIQTVEGIFSANNTAYAVLEYINGMPLKTYLSGCGGTMTWEEVKELFPPILTTLSLIHGFGIIHRGLSPTTIYVTDKQELKLTGFGISASRTADSDINCEVFAGYAPPELYSSAERNGSWTDVYGIAAVLYRVLTGQVPPDAQARLEEDKLIEPMLINRNIPDNVSHVLMKGLGLHQAQRIQTITEFVDRLFEQPKHVVENSAEISISKTAPKSAEGAYSPDLAEKPAPRKKPPVKHKKKKKKSNVPAIVGIVFGLVVVIGFIIAILLPTMNSGKEPVQTTTTTVATTEPEATTAPPVTTAPAEVTTTGTEIGYVLPDFTNRVFDSIKDSPKYSYLNFVPTYEFNNEYGDGVIFEQDLESGTTVTSGTTINIKISKGAEFVPLPDYIGIDVEAYKEMLSSLNIKYETKQREDTEHKAGIVIECSAEIGENINVAEGQTVTVYYAVAPAEEELIED